MKTAILIFFALVSFASAKIGMNRAQMIARYGEPEEEANSVIRFTKSGYNVMAMMRDDKCIVISFQKSGNADDNRLKLTAEEIAVLLVANGDGKEWVNHPLAEEEGRLLWHLKDAGIAAEYKTWRGLLSISLIKEMVDESKGGGVFEKTSNFLKSLLK